MKNVVEKRQGAELRKKLRRDSFQPSQLICWAAAKHDWPLGSPALRTPFGGV